MVSSFMSSRVGLLLFALLSLSAHFGMVVAQTACPNGGVHKISTPIGLFCTEPACRSFCGTFWCRGEEIHSRCTTFPNCECCCGKAKPPKPPVPSPPPPSPPPPSPPPPPPSPPPPPPPSPPPPPPSPPPPPPPSPPPPPPSPPPPPPPTNQNDLCLKKPTWTSQSYPATGSCLGPNPCPRPCICPPGKATSQTSTCKVDTCSCCCEK